jgi:uncharacterized protein (TIGR01319 family)
MRVDVLIAEIGSTTTIINAFDGIYSGRPVLVGQGQAGTTVLEGDVNIGLLQAIENLKHSLKADAILYDELFATSSAAGGLRMSVHGLVYDMTVRAGREAALGAGGVIKFASAGRLRPADLEQVKQVQPNLILLAGGVDYGERDTALFNYQALMQSMARTPVLYAGNVENQPEIAALARKCGNRVYFSENVYPSVDQINIESTRKLIHQAFEDHITQSPGMENILDMVNGPIIPTPGAVMECARLLYEQIGDLVVFDVGGATTDLHSVTEGSAEIACFMTGPEPFAKRTVEGDLGVYLNREHLVNLIGIDALRTEFPDVARLSAELPPIPRSAEEFAFVERLTREACRVALSRHAGKLAYIFGPTGRKTVATGKDLSAVRSIVGTGGALTRLPHRVDILKQLRRQSSDSALYPHQNAEILIDKFYIMASLGVLSLKYPEQAGQLLMQTLDLPE